MPTLHTPTRLPSVDQTLPFMFVGGASLLFAGWMGMVLAVRAEDVYGPPPHGGGGICGCSYAVEKMKETPLEIAEVGYARRV